MDKKRSSTNYVICISNDGVEDILIGKVYQLIQDEAAALEGYSRIIDESGEDYLYPARFFVTITLPKTAEQALFSSSSPFDHS